MLRGCLQNDRKLLSLTENSTLDLIDTDMVISFRAFLGARFNAATETLAVHVEHIPEVQLQMTRQARGTPSRIVRCLTQQMNEKLFPSLLSSSPIRPNTPTISVAGNFITSHRSWHKA